MGLQSQETKLGRQDKEPDTRIGKAQGWKSMPFKCKDKSISIIHTKSKEWSKVDIKNKKLRLKIIH